MKAFLLLLFICLGFPVLQSCRDKDEPEHECTPDITIPFPQDALDRFYFKTGTWWVYEEINNPGMEDSVWISDHRKNTSQPNEKVYGPIATKKCYDSYITWVNSSQFGGFKVNMKMYGPYDGFNYEKELFEIIDQQIGYELVNRALIRGNSYDDQTDFGNSISLIDSIETQEGTYYNALYFERTQSIYDFLHQAWYIKNIGLVKFERVDGSEWELVRYSIVQ